MSDYKREQIKEFEVERDAFAKLVAASNVSNADFHAALADFDRENDPRTQSGEARHPKS